MSYTEQEKLNSKHTFVICAYKESPYLEDCILSLKSQTVKSDIIISTSTPNDFISNLALKYEIKVYVHDKGGSIGKDWNYGYSIAKTKYVTITHQDDIYLPEFLEINLKGLNSSDKSILAFTNYDEIDQNSDLIERTINLKIKDVMLQPFKFFKSSRFVRNRVFSFGYPICSPTATYNKDILSDFKFSEIVCGAIDWEAFYRINLIKGRWYYSKKRLIKHRIHTDSETSSAILTSKRTNEEEMMFRYYWPDFMVKIIMKFYVKAQKTNSR